MVRTSYALVVYADRGCDSMIGMYHQRRAYQCAQRGESIDMIDHFVESFGHFFTGAGMYPQDDEMHPCRWHLPRRRHPISLRSVPGFMHVALQMMPMGASPFTLVLDLLGHLRSTSEKAARIWGLYQAMEGKDKALATDLRLEQKIRKDLADGRISTEDYIRPNYMQSFHESDASL